MIDFITKPIGFKDIRIILLRANWLFFHSSKSLLGPNVLLYLYLKSFLDRFDPVPIFMHIISNKIGIFFNIKTKMI